MNSCGWGKVESGEKGSCGQRMGGKGALASWQNWFLYLAGM